MGLLDKIKNTFFEEEYVEVEEKPKKVKHEKHKAVEEKQKKPVVVEQLEDEEQEVEEVKHNRVERIEEIPVEEEVFEPIVKEEKKEKFSYFDEDDFLDYEQPGEVVKEEPKSLYSNHNYGSYNSQTQTNNYKTSNNAYGNSRATTYSRDNSGFTPTPIISPIYGVLDKNYKKEEILEKKEVKPSSSYVSRKNVDLDSIRAKAFGGSRNDFHEEEIEEEYQENNTPVVEEDNLLYDMTEVDRTPSVEKVTLQDAEEYYDDLGLEYNVDYHDAKMEKAKGRRVSKPQPIDDFEEDEVMPDDVIENTDESNDLSIEDNLFDLIDSMYEERD